jgi:hypothetical protein
MNWRLETLWYNVNAAKHYIESAMFSCEQNVFPANLPTIQNLMNEIFSSFISIVKYGAEKELSKELDNKLAERREIFEATKKAIEDIVTSSKPSTLKLGMELATYLSFVKEIEDIFTSIKDEVDEKEFEIFAEEGRRRLIIKKKEEEIRVERKPKSMEEES